MDQLREKARADINKVEGELKRFVQAKLAAVRRGMDKLNSALDDVDAIQQRWVLPRFLSTLRLYRWSDRARGGLGAQGESAGIPR